MNKILSKIVFSQTLFSMTCFALAEARAEIPYSTRKYAIGAAYSFGNKKNGTDDSYKQSSGEVFGYLYPDLLSLNQEFIIRPGIRLGFTPEQEPKSAAAVSISEKDFKSTLEATLIWKNPPLFPALTVGGGMIYRTTTLTAQAPVVSTGSAIGGSSLLPFVQSQFSLILPIQEGKFELAPFTRYTHIFSDSRTGISYGLEGSIAY